MSTIGERITKLRESKNLTTKELGLKCGVSDGTISNIETGKTASPSIQLVTEIINVLKLSPEQAHELVFGEELKTAQQNKINNLQSEIERLKEQNYMLTKIAYEKTSSAQSHTQESNTHKAGAESEKLRGIKIHESQPP